MLQLDRLLFAIAVVLYLLPPALLTTSAQQTTSTTAPKLNASNSTEQFVVRNLFVETVMGIIAALGVPTLYFIQQFVRSQARITRLRDLNKMAYLAASDAQPLDLGWVLQSLNAPFAPFLASAETAHPARVMNSSSISAAVAASRGGGGGGLLRRRGGGEGARGADGAHRHAELQAAGGEGDAAGNSSNGSRGANQNENNNHNNGDLMDGEQDEIEMAMRERLGGASAAASVAAAAAADAAAAAAGDSTVPLGLHQLGAEATAAALEEDFLANNEGGGAAGGGGGGAASSVCSSCHCCPGVSCCGLCDGDVTPVTMVVHAARRQCAAVLAASAAEIFSAAATSPPGTHQQLLDAANSLAANKLQKYGATTPDSFRHAADLWGNLRASRMFPRDVTSTLRSDVFATIMSARAAVQQEQHPPPGGFGAGGGSRRYAQQMAQYLHDPELMSGLCREIVAMQLALTKCPRHPAVPTSDAVSHIVRLSL